MNANLREERIQEIVRLIADGAPSGAVPTAADISALASNKWVCDYETHRTLWEAQCMCSLIDDALDSGESTPETVQLAIQGIERLLAGAIKRTGWAGIGWQNRT